MNYIISTFFLIFINVVGVLILLICAPLVCFNNTKVADFSGRVWAKFMLWALRVICRIDYEVIGWENLPKEPFILACKHQSSWEGIALSAIFKYPACIYKKELQKIPLYGWHLRAMSGIKIDRQGGASVIKSLIRQAKKYLGMGRMIVIFPQGTRVPAGASAENYPYQAGGIAALYLSCNVKVVPAALNSGSFWPKGDLHKAPGTITLKLLEPIEPGLKKAEFMEKLEAAIETSSSELFQNAKK